MISGAMTKKLIIMVSLLNVVAGISSGYCQIEAACKHQNNNKEFAEMSFFKICWTIFGI